MQITDAQFEDLMARIRQWWKDVGGSAAPAAAAPPPPTAAPPAPSSAGAPWEGRPLTFDEHFDQLDFNRWSTVYRWNQYDGVDDPRIRGSSQFGNREEGWNINRNYPATQGIKPWRVEGGELVIIADRTPPNLVPILGYDQADARNLGAYPYTTGCLHTGSSFLQQYGYFEAEVKWVKGKGLWPAFWLLPHKGKPPEIDILEVLCQEPDRIYHTIHSADGPQHVESYIPDLDFHRYGVLWTREKIAWYVDGREVGSKPTPADFHVPMYIILNLAVGGAWPGPPDFFTPFPAEMRVRRVAAWA